MMSPMPWLAAWPRNGRRLWGRRTLVFVTKRAAPEATVALRPRGLASSLQSSVQSKVALKQPLARQVQSGTHLPMCGQRQASSEAASVLRTLWTKLSCQWQVWVFKGLKLVTCRRSWWQTRVKVIFVFPSHSRPVVAMAL